MTGTFGNGASGASPPEAEDSLAKPTSMEVTSARPPAFEKYFPKNAHRTAPLGTKFKNTTSPKTKDALRVLRKRLAEKPKRTT